MAEVLAEFKRVGISGLVAKRIVKRLSSETAAGKAFAVSRAMIDGSDTQPGVIILAGKTIHVVCRAGWMDVTHKSGEFREPLKLDISLHPVTHDGRPMAAIMVPLAAGGRLPLGILDRNELYCLAEELGTSGDVAVADFDAAVVAEQQRQDAINRRGVYLLQKSDEMKPSDEVVRRVNVFTTLCVGAAAMHLRMDGAERMMAAARSFIGRPVEPVEAVNLVLLTQVIESIPIYREYALEDLVWARQSFPSSVTLDEMIDVLGHAMNVEIEQTDTSFLDYSMADDTVNAFVEQSALARASGDAFVAEQLAAFGPFWEQMRQPWPKAAASTEPIDEN